MKTTLVYHNDYLKHRQPDGHPESPERLQATMDYFEDKGILEMVEILKPEKVQAADILPVHDTKLIELVRSISEKGGGPIDADTYVCSETYDVALLACGGLKCAVDAVMTGECDNSFALVRPPGHHASKNTSAGFCYFNNVAFAAKYVQKKHNLERVLIFDWDAHNFNGTMDIFYDDPTVLDISVHQDPQTLYPGTGFTNQTGEGKGEGYTINLPVPAGTADIDYMYLIENVVEPAIDRFNPDFIIISAGQDSHVDDMLSSLCLTESGYAQMTEFFMQAANKYCNNRLIVSLEGGYNLEALKKSNYQILACLAGTVKTSDVRGNVKDSTKKLSVEHSQVII